MKTLFALLAVLAICAYPLQAKELPVAEPEAVGVSSERLNRVDTLMQDYIDDQAIAGAVISVTRQGKLFYHKAFGYADVENGIPMKTDTIFRIASMTKAITSVAVMMLQEEGKLRILDPVGKYLPEYMETTVVEVNEDGSHDIVPAKRPITIRDLLSHSSGVGRGTPGVTQTQWQKAGFTAGSTNRYTKPIREFVREMAKLPMNAHPGERWTYGFSTDILGALIEVVSGKPLDVFFKERIFDPLDMKDTHFFLPVEKSDRFAKLYAAKVGGGIVLAGSDTSDRDQGVFIDGPRVCFSGGGGLVSTARDYTRFLEMVINEGTLFGERLLSRKSIELMAADHLGDIEIPGRSGQSFGLAFAIVEDVGARGWIGSEGELTWGGAYHTIYWIDPQEDMTITYMTQLRPARGLNDRERLRTMIYQAIID